MLFMVTRHTLSCARSEEGANGAEMRSVHGCSLQSPNGVCLLPYDLNASLHLSVFLTYQPGLYEGSSHRRRFDRPPTAVFAFEFYRERASAVPGVYLRSRDMLLPPEKSETTTLLPEGARGYQLDHQGERSTCTIYSCVRI